ncbi:response regulator transcription factor [Streptomyces zhihengii]
MARNLCAAGRGGGPPRRLGRAGRLAARGRGVLPHGGPAQRLRGLPGAAAPDGRPGAAAALRRRGGALDLRRCGITVREFEVARLVAERIGNKDIAGRLHISHRTVEKHVASLLQKTGHPNRAAFASAARADLVT